MVTSTRLIWLLLCTLGVGGCAHVPLQSSQEAKRNVYALYMRGLMLERSAHLSDALETYQQALEHDYESPSLYVRIGATYVKLGEIHQALKSFQRALTLDPSHRDALRWVAMLHTSQGELDEAIRAYERLIEQEPTDRFVLSTLADLYVLQGQLEQAAHLYERLIKEYGSSSQLRFNLGVLYGRLGQYSSAIQELSRAMELAPDSIEIRVVLGLTYELNNQLDKAAAHFEDAIRLDPLNPRLYLHAARVYASQQRTKEAIDEYETALDLAPNDLEALFGLVRLWLVDKQYAKAQHVIGEKLPNAAQPADLYLMLGVVYREADAPAEALRAFERAVALNGTSAQAHFYLGAQLDRLQRKQEARQELRRTIELDPNHADALNYLGYLDAEAGVNLKEAKALIERAVALDPDNGAYLDSLGWVSYQLGELDEAIRQLERAATLLDTDPTVFDHLGDAYRRQGNLKKAQAAWENALRLDASLEVVKHKLESLLHRDVMAIAP